MNFDEKAKLPVGVQLEVDEILPGGAGPAVGEGNETTFEEYAAQVEEALHLEEGSESFLRVLDIKLVDEDGHKLVIAAPVDVRIELADMDVSDETAAKTQIVHFAEKYEDGAYQLLTRVVSGSGSGSAGAGNGSNRNGNGSEITGAGAGSAYAGTGSAADDDEEIADTQTVSRKAKSGDTSEGDANGGAGGNGNAAPTVINTANKDNASTIITDDTPIEITTDVVKDVEFKDGAIKFKTDSFSAYAIVTGPEPVTIGYEKVTSLDQLTGNALYLSHKLENKETYFFFGNSVVTQGNRKGITKIKPASATPPANAALYYFEEVPGTSNQFFFKFKYFKVNEISIAILITSSISAGFCGMLLVNIYEKVLLDTIGYSAFYLSAMIESVLFFFLLLIKIYDFSLIINELIMKYNNLEKENVVKQFSYRAFAFFILFNIVNISGIIFCLKFILDLFLEGFNILILKKKTFAQKQLEIYSNTHHLI